VAHQKEYGTEIVPHSLGAKSDSIR